MLPVSTTLIAASVVPSFQIANRIRSSVQDLGRSCVEVVQDAGALQADPTDAYSRQELCEHSLSVNEKVLYAHFGHIGLQLFLSCLTKWLSS